MKVHITSLSQRMEDLNPFGILKRGYSVTMRKDTGEVIVDAKAVQMKDEVVVRLYRGELDCSVKDRRYS